MRTDSITIAVKALTEIRDASFEDWAKKRASAALVKIERNRVRGAKDIIEDGFGSAWSIVCPTCRRRSMQIVRPGKVQCGHCG